MEGKEFGLAVGNVLGITEGLFEGVSRGREEGEEVGITKYEVGNKVGDCVGCFEISPVLGVGKDITVVGVEGD